MKSTNENILNQKIEDMSLEELKKYNKDLGQNILKSQNKYYKLKTISSSLLTTTILLGPMVALSSSLAAKIGLFGLQLGSMAAYLISRAKKDKESKKLGELSDNSNVAIQEIQNKQMQQEREIFAEFNTEEDELF